jgi:predicted 3-demethylubiquinone-9 3-methyltransferase (glyoxalase superfamily)
MMANKVTPFLWFDNNAEEAASFYVSIFKDSKINTVVWYNDAGPGPKGSVMTVDFELDGQRFTALNGGPHFTFSPAISFVVHCQTQAEVDDYWDKLSAGGQIQQCGWLTDKYGVSWQIVPSQLLEYLQDTDAKRRTAVTRAMLQMIKLDIAALRRAYEQA